MGKTVIPKKYLALKSAMYAFTHIRKWCSDETRIRQAAEEVVDAYGQANDTDRGYLAEMLAIIMGLRSEDFSRRCMPDAVLKTFEHRSVGESIYTHYDCGVGGPERSACIDPCVWDWSYLQKKPDLSRHKFLLHRDDLNNILTVSDSDEIYVCRSNDGTVRIFILDNREEDMLIDEEPFNGNCPLYFTEDSHFISPVFKLKVVMKILNFFFAEIGYPSVRIIPEVIFTSSGAHLINRYDYMHGGEISVAWKGINVTTRRDVKGLYILDSIVCFINDYPGRVFSDILVYKLLEALSATAIMYSKIELSPSVLNYTTSKLRKMAKSFGILTEKKI